MPPISLANGSEYLGADHIHNHDISIFLLDP